jgi:hypothetical protein
MREVVTEFKEGNIPKRPKARPEQATAQTPKREALVCVLVRTAAAGLPIEFKWNYFDELKKN